MFSASICARIFTCLSLFYLSICHFVCLCLSPLSPSPALSLPLLSLSLNMDACVISHPKLDQLPDEAGVLDSVVDLPRSLLSQKVPASVRASFRLFDCPHPTTNKRFRKSNKTKTKNVRITSYHARFCSTVLHSYFTATPTSEAESNMQKIKLRTLYALLQQYYRSIYQGNANDKSWLSWKRSKGWVVIDMPSEY